MAIGVKEFSTMKKPLGLIQGKIILFPHHCIPLILSDTHMLKREKHFNREYISKRIIHAKGYDRFEYF